MSEASFRCMLEQVDILVKIDFYPEGFPMCIRVRPSHPRYRQELISQARLYRPIGVLVSVIEEVDDWNCCCDNEEEKRQGLLNWLKGLKWKRGNDNA